MPHPPPIATTRILLLTPAVPGFGRQGFPFLIVLTAVILVAAGCRTEPRAPDGLVGMYELVHLLDRDVPRETPPDERQWQDELRESGRDWLFLAEDGAVVFGALFQYGIAARYEVWDDSIRVNLGGNHYALGEIRDGALTLGVPGGADNHKILYRRNSGARPAPHSLAALAGTYEARSNFRMEAIRLRIDGLGNYDLIIADTSGAVRHEGTALLHGYRIMLASERLPQGLVGYVPDGDRIGLALGEGALIHTLLRVEGE